MRLVVLLALAQMISSCTMSEKVRPLQLAQNNSPLLLKVILSPSKTRLATPLKEVENRHSSPTLLLLPSNHFQLPLKE